MAFSTVTSNYSPYSPPAINEGALSICIPLKVLSHFTLRSIHNSQTQHSQTQHSQTQHSQTQHSQTQHSQTQIAQWHELGIQSRSKQQLHKLIDRYQLNTPINFEALTPAYPITRDDRLGDIKLQMQCIIKLIHKLTMQCQSTYPNMKTDGLSELTEESIKNIVNWFEIEFIWNRQCRYLQTGTRRLFHQLHSKINNYSADCRTVDFCLLDVHFMHRLSNKEKTVYVAIVLKLVTSSKGIAILKTFNHERWKSAYLGIWHLCHTLTVTQVFNCDADFLYDLIVTHQLSDVEIKKYSYPTIEVLTSAKALQWWHNLPTNLITGKPVLSSPSSVQLAKENQCLNSMVSPYLFKADSVMHNGVVVKAPCVESLIFGEELELNFSSCTSEIEQSSITSLHTWRIELEKLCIEQGFNIETYSVDCIKIILTIGNWQLLSFIDGDVIECHTTPYEADQYFTIVQHDVTKRMTCSELLDVTVLKLAKSKQLQGRSGHKHIDISKAFNGNPELMLRFVLLFNQFTFLPRVLNRLPRLYHFDYLEINPQTQAAIYQLNQYISEGRMPVQDDYQKLIDLVVLFEKLFNINKKYIAVNLDHIKTGVPSRDILTSPNSTIELRMFHCPKSGLEIEAINKFIQGILTLAWVELITRKPLELAATSPFKYVNQAEQAEKEMARLCKKIGLTFMEFQALMRIKVTEACTTQGGYSQDEFLAD